jgi:hypothetical protein
MALQPYPRASGGWGRGGARASFFKMELEQGTKYGDFCFEELREACVGSGVGESDGSGGHLAEVRDVAPPGYL